MKLRLTKNFNKEENRWEFIAETTVDGKLYSTYSYLPETDDKEYLIDLMFGWFEQTLRAFEEKQSSIESRMPLGSPEKAADAFK